MRIETHVAIERNILARAYEIHIFRIADDKLAFAKVDFVNADPNATAFRHRDMDPAVMLPYDTATELMDELWRMGVRPTDYQDNTPALEAKAAILEEMYKHLLSELTKRGV